MAVRIFENILHRPRVCVPAIIVVGERERSRILAKLNARSNDKIFNRRRDDDDFADGLLEMASVMSDREENGVRGGITVKFL